MDAPVPRPAATLVALRDASDGLEVLLLQRARSDGSATGAWVFPGGQIEAGEAGAAGDDPVAAARAAAARETREEAGISVAPDALGLIARWITPPVAKRRFDTWFFLVGLAANTPVEVDGSEIHTHRWLAPAAALAGHQAGDLRLPPPTFVTLSWLAEHDAVETARAALVSDEVPTYEPRICPQGDGACMLYPGDAGYVDGDLERPGGRNRLWATPSGLRYERQPA